MGRITSIILLATFSPILAGEISGWKPTDSDLLFVSARTGNGEIYVLPAGETELKNLTNHKAGDTEPSWSPDARRIVFKSFRTGNHDIWVMNADGSEQTQLTDNIETDYQPSWSSDGKLITFISFRKEKGDVRSEAHIYVMNADGSNQRRLIKEKVYAIGGVSWSADGKHIAFVRKPADLGADIFIANADGSNERQLTHDHEKDITNSDPSFSPDGKWIAFHSSVRFSESTSIDVMNVEGNQRRTIVADGYNWCPRWSPDSLWLTYTHTDTVGEKSNTDVFAIKIAGGEPPVRLVSSPQGDAESSWSPSR